MTLLQFVRNEGSQEKAARKLGITYVSLNRWVNAKTNPSPLAWQILKENGVTKIK